MLSYLSHNRNISEKGSGDKVKIGGGNQPMERKDDSVSVSGTTSEPDKISDLGQKQSVESNTPEAETAGTGEKRPLEIRYQHHNLRSIKGRHTVNHFRQSFRDKSYTNVPIHVWTFLCDVFLFCSYPGWYDWKHLQIPLHPS